MNRKSLLKTYIKYAAFNMLGMLGISFYIVADTFFVAKGLGLDGLTALNLAVPVFNFVDGVGLMLGMGGATKFAVFQSEGRQDLADRIFTNTVMLGLIFSAFFMAIGMLLSNPLTRLLGADHTIFSMTKTYLKTVLLFAPAYIFEHIFTCFVRNDKAPELSMSGMVLGSITNIILDYLFIFPLQMGLFGAVLATSLSPLVHMAVLCLHLFQGKNHIHFQKPTLDFSICLSTLSIGVPSLITEAATGLVMIVFNELILSLSGNIGVAAYSVIANLTLIVAALFNGISQGMQPLISRSYGLENSKYIATLRRYALATSLVLSAIIYLLFFTFASPITSLFNRQGNPVMQSIAVTGMRLYFIGIFFAGPNIVLSMYFPSIESPKPGQLICLLRGCFIIVPLAFIMARLGGIYGIWLSFPLAEFIVAIISLSLLKKHPPVFQE